MSVLLVLASRRTPPPPLDMPRSARTTGGTLAPGRKAKVKAIHGDLLAEYQRELPSFDIADQQFRFRLAKGRRFRLADEISDPTLPTISSSSDPKDSAPFLGVFGAEKGPKEQISAGLLDPSQETPLTPESVEWRDEGNAFSLNDVPFIAGSLTIRRPDGQSDSRWIESGDRVRCDVYSGGRWHRVWDGRVLTARTVAEDGTWQVEFKEDLFITSLSEADFKYKKGKKTRTKGWRYDEIVMDICRRFHIPVVSMPRGTKRIVDFQQRRTSPLEAIRLAVERESKWSGRPYVIRWVYDDRLGRWALSVAPMRRNDLIWVFASQIQAASVAHGFRGIQGQITTAVVAHAKMLVTKPQAKKRKKPSPKGLKVTMRAVSVEGVRQFGYVRRPIRIPGKVPSYTELSKEVNRRLAAGLRERRVVEGFSHPGVWKVRRGDAVQVNLPSGGLKGEASLLFVTAAQHALSAGDYTMTLSLSYTDLLDPAKLKRQREAALRAQKRRKKSKKKDNN